MKALLLLSGLGVISLLAEIFNFKKPLLSIVLIGLFATLIVTVSDWDTSLYHFKMMYFDNYAVSFTALLIGIAFFWFLTAGDYLSNVVGITDYFALILFALCGAVVMVSYSNMVMLFIGIEILSISSYVLAGSNKSDLASNEAAFKYFLMGSFATGFLLFGIALIYGVSGSFDLKTIADYTVSNTTDTPRLLYAGVLFLLVGLAFKVSVVPFHFWAPDVYQGAPTMITSFMATIVKTAAFAAFFRLFYICFPNLGEVWVEIIWVMAALTSLIGNITAVYQNSVKRMLAYSSISHAGYMMLGLLAMNQTSASALLYYSGAYAFATITTFYITYILIKNKGNDDIDSFNGLSKTNPLMAVTMLIALLSLAGIPPLAGFFAKYYIFTTALQSGYVGLVVIALLGSLIGVYYYFRIVIAMFFKGEGETPAMLHLNTTGKLLLIILTLITIALGLFPAFIINLLT